ncbi:MAG: lipase family protein [Pseudonocardiaceae bacterium]
MRRTRLSLLLCCVLGVAVGCTSAASEESAAAAGPKRPAAPVGPEGLAFYLPPPAPDGAQPGDLIWVRPLDSPQGTQGHAILYWSTGVDGRLVAESGVVFEPTGPPPELPRGILAWAHGSPGLADQCAPSRDYFEGDGVSVPLMAAVANEGLIFVASDYEGLGTPGEHPFIVNRAAGDDVLDSIRAAMALTGSRESPSVIMGQSRGGAAALVAAEMQPRYAPELPLAGVVAVSAPSRLDILDEQLAGGPYVGYLMMAVHGYRVAYPQLDIAGLTEAGQAVLERIPGQCLGEILADAYEAVGVDSGVSSVLNTPEFVKLLMENDAGHLRPDAPVLLVHGESDNTVPVATSRELLQRYCAIGAQVTASYHPDQGHVEVFGAALPDIASFVRNRLAGTPTTPTCS